MLVLDKDVSVIIKKSRYSYCQKTVNSTFTEYLQLTDVLHNALLQAGIPSSCLKIALEPEAASLFCKTVAVEKRTQSNLTVSTFESGAKYIVLDCGGKMVYVNNNNNNNNNNNKDFIKDEAQLAFHPIFPGFLSMKIIFNVVLFCRWYGRRIGA